MKKLQTNLDYALHYREKLGFSIIPLGPESKLPLNGMRWKIYQTTKPTSEQIKRWFLKNPDLNIGIVAGSISGIAVVDIDNEDVFKKTCINLPPTVNVKTSKGFHAYYRINDNTKIKQYKLKYRGLDYGDFKSEGGYVVAPPSIHDTSKKQYFWTTIQPESIGDIEFLPKEFISNKKETQNLQKLYKSLLNNEIITEGNRNNAITSLCGKLMSSISPKDWESTIWPIMEAQNEQNCLPPLNRKELLTIFNSVCNMQKNNPNKSKPEEEKEASFKIDTNKDMFSITPTPKPYIIENLIYEGAINAITADSGKGKSLFMLILARYIALGEPLFGVLETKKKKVLIVDQEMDKDLLAERYQQIIPKDVDVEMMYEQNFKLTKQKDREWITQEIKEKNYGVVVFDTLITIHDLNENDNSEMSQLSDFLLELKRETGVTIIYLHHHRKLGQGEKHSQSSSRGSTEIMAKMASHLLLDSKQETDAEGQIITKMSIKQEKSRRPSGVYKIGFDVIYDPIEKSVSWNYTGEIDEDKLTSEKAKDEIKVLLSFQDEGMSIKEMSKESDIGESNIRTACRELLKINELDVKHGVEGYNPSAGVYFSPKAKED